MEAALSKFNFAIGRSHMYWGRKPLVGLQDIFKNVKENGLILDPFCGGGNSVLAAILQRGRVVAGDLNPMAVFLTKVLVRSISIPSLKAAFEDVEDMVAETILENYAEECPNCKEKAYLDYLVWSETEDENQPVAAKFICKHCGIVKLKELSISLIDNQLELSQKQPLYWYPKNRILSTTRRPPVEHHYELFTGRNLAGLSELFHAIEQIPFENCRNALRYVFTAILYSCSKMQMYSAKYPSSSRGWTAQRYYIPPKRKEKNVWYAFKNRFENLLKCKSMINSKCFVRVTNLQEDFFTKNFEVLLCESDTFDLISKFGEYAHHVILDPPYIDDVDYFAFSQFWGSWLQMKFDFDAEWHPKSLKGEGLGKLLKLVHEKTKKTSEISLLISPKDPTKWYIQDCISSSGYEVKRRGQFLYNNSNKRKGADQPKDEYFLLKKKGYRKKIAQKQEKLISEEPLKENELYLYYKLAKFLNSDVKVEKVRSEANKFIPERLSGEMLGKDVIEDIIKNEENNKRAYNSLCYAFINKFLSKDNWKIIYADPAYFEDNIFGISLTEVSKTLPSNLLDRSAFIARKDDRQIHFCFDYCWKTCPKVDQQLILERDDQKHKDLCVMIVKSKETMPFLRRNNKSHPGVFFVCFEEIREKCEEIYKDEYLKLCAPYIKTETNDKEVSSIASVMAEIIDNIQVGENGKVNHFKLRFRAPKLPRIVPGQFIMINTSPKKRLPESVPVELNEVRSSFKLKPEAYLKRPFGIHRAYYPNFDHDYLKNINLPPTLATIMHTEFPHEFDIFYKVLKYGAGTNEMKKLRRGDKIEVLGPLGKRFDLRKLRTQGINEVHVIGGGVGMAPLIFLVQALRFFTFKIKAFIGIESLDILKHKDDSFTEDPENVRLYVDDLKAIGVDISDVFVSCDKESKTEGVVLESNYHHGLVSKQYEEYLKNGRELKNVLAFTCGPIAMMRQISKITDKCNIPLKVLMEKHMGCGIGVCLSCTCETINNESPYSRVCVEGPIFNGNEIVWNKND